MSKKKASILNLIFNYSNVVFLILNGLVLIPIYLKYISVSTYGSFLASGNIVSMIGLLDGGMSYVLTQKLSNSYSQKAPSDFNKILTSGLLITIFISLVVILLSLTVLPFISDIVKIEPEQKYNIKICFILSAISACISIFYNNISAIFQSALQVQYTGYSNLFSIIISLFAILLGLYYGLGIVSIALGYFIKSLSSCTLLLFFLKKVLRDDFEFKYNLDRKNLLSLVKTSLPMFGGSVSKSLINNSQLLIINIFISPSAAAIYFITARVFQVCDSFLAPISSAIFSSISHIYSSEQKDKIKFIISNVFVIFSCFSILIISIGFILNETFITLLVGSDKFGGSLLTLLLAISTFFYSRFSFISVNLFAIGIFGKTTMFDILSGVIRLTLIFTLIGKIGVVILPIAEIFSALFVSGVFLNKLIVNKLMFDRKETISFIFSGIKPIILILLINSLVVHFCQWSITWPGFIFEATSLTIGYIIILFLATIEVRRFVIPYLRKFKILAI